MNKLKELFKSVDMTMGKPWDKILMFMVPMLIGNIAQQFYNTVDSIVVGKYVGDNALAAVGSAGPIVNLLIVLFVGISTGASVIVSQYFGGKKREELSRTIGSCILLTAIAVALIMIIAGLVARPLLVILNTPDSIIDWCHSYLLIMFLGSAGLAYYNIFSGVLRGLGDSVSALIYLMIASGLNIVLDILFVVKFEMGVNGVALATVLAQAASAILCIRKLAHMTNLFDLKLSYIRWNKKYAGNIIRLGLPTGITQSIMSISMLLVQSLANGFGETFIAANVIVMRVDGFAMLPAFSFGTALTTYAGQNVGAGYYERVEKGAVQGNIMAVGTSALITSLILLFGKPLMGIFTNTPELVTLSMNLMKILAVGYIAVAVTQNFSGIMRGAGDTLTPMWISFISTFIIRVPLAYAMVYFTRSDAYPLGREESLFVSQLIAWLLGAVMSFISYKWGTWKTKAIS